MKANYGLFIRNARACENAKHPKCRCICGGKAHGKSHLAVLDDLWAAYQERERAKDDAARAADQLPT